MNMGWREGYIEWVTDDLIDESLYVIKAKNIEKDEVNFTVRMLVKSVHHFASFTLIRVNNLDNGIEIFEDDKKVLKLVEVLDSVDLILGNRLRNGEINSYNFSSYKEIRNLAVKQWNRMKKFENVVIGTYNGYEMTFREYVEGDYKDW